MTKIKTTRREFVKNSIVTGLMTGSFVSSTKLALADDFKFSQTQTLKRRDNEVLNQANMFDMPEAYALGWGRAVLDDGRVTL